MIDEQKVLGLEGDTRETESADKDRPRKYLKTREASAHLRKSVSWLIRRKDIPYLPGNPNTYALADLDDWFEKNKHTPLL